MFKVWKKSWGKGKNLGKGIIKSYCAFVKEHKTRKQVYQRVCLCTYIHKSNNTVRLYPVRFLSKGKGITAYPIYIFTYYTIPLSTTPTHSLWVSDSLHTYCTSTPQWEPITSVPHIRIQLFVLPLFRIWAGYSECTLLYAKSTVVFHIRTN